MPRLRPRVPHHGRTRARSGRWVTIACCGGDRTDPVAVSRLMDGRKAAMAFTDPPCNVSLGDHGSQQFGQRRRRMRNDALSPEAWQDFCWCWARNLLQSVDGASYIAMSSKELG